MAHSRRSASSYNSSAAPDGARSRSADSGSACIASASARQRLRYRMYPGSAQKTPPAAQSTAAYSTGAAGRPERTNTAAKTAAAPAIYSAAPPCARI